jgi:hypothetical protein
MSYGLFHRNAHQYQWHEPDALLFFVSAFSVGTQLSGGLANRLLLGGISRLAVDYTEVADQNEEKMEINMDKNEVSVKGQEDDLYLNFS